MDKGWRHVALDDFERRRDKPGQRWELSPELGVDAFNFNVAVLEHGERLSQSHYHYHPNQSELIYVAAGRCRVEVDGDGFVVEQDDAVHFDSGPDGVHLVHNPFDDPVRLVAIGWPPEGRHPVETVVTTDELLAERANEK